MRQTLKAIGRWHSVLWCPMPKQAVANCSNITYSQANNQDEIRAVLGTLVTHAQAGSSQLQQSDSHSEKQFACPAALSLLYNCMGRKAKGIAVHLQTTKCLEAFVSLY